MSDQPIQAVGEEKGCGDVDKENGTRVPTIYVVRPSSRVAAFDEQYEAGNMEESGFGETEEQVVRACHEGCRLGRGSTRCWNGQRQKGRLPIPSCLCKKSMEWQPKIAEARRRY